MPDKQKRDKQIQMRVTSDEKEMLKIKANDNGFRSVTSFIVWVIRNFNK